MGHGFKEIDSPVQMRLYSLTKHRFVMVFIAFCLAFFMVLVIGILGPEAIGQQSTTAKDLGVPEKRMTTGPFLINSGSVTKFNQDIWLFAQVKLNKLPLKKDYNFEREFSMVVMVLGSSKDATYQMINNAYRNRTRILKCDVESCETLVVFHLGSLNSPSYLVNVTLYGLDLPRGVSIRNIVFTFKFYQDQFTQIQIWFRFVFLVLAFMVTCLFMHSLRKFPVREWCIEQRWMSILLPLLLLYDNPLFPLEFLTKSYAPALIDAIFEGTFFSGLLMFWLCAFHGIRQNDRKLVSFYLPKIIIIGLLWLVGCTILAWQEVNEIGDPSYQYKVDSGHFMGLKVFFFILAGCYVIYLVVLMIQAFQELRNMPYFDVRLKFLTILMLLVVLISLVAVFLRFGSAVLQDNFVMDVSSAYKNSAEFLAFYGLFNVYLYTMAYMYSPSPHAIKDANVRKEASSFTMLADSEDEFVQYDRGEIKKTLTKIHENKSDGDSSDYHIAG